MAAGYPTLLYGSNTASRVSIGAVQKTKSSAAGYPSLLYGSNSAPNWNIGVAQLPSGGPPASTGSFFTFFN